MGHPSISCVQFTPNINHLKTKLASVIFKLVCWCPATRAGQVHSFTQVTWKPCDPGMHDTLMYVVTAVTPKPGKQNTPIYMVTMETSYLGRQATLMYIIHVESP